MLSTALPSATASSAAYGLHNLPTAQKMHGQTFHLFSGSAHVLNGTVTAGLTLLPVNEDNNLKPAPAQAKGHGLMT